MNQVRASAVVVALLCGVAGGVTVGRAEQAPAAPSQSYPVGNPLDGTIRVIEP